MIPMFKQKVGMTKIYAKGIAELFLIRCNPYHWDGSGEVPDNISFDVYKRKIDETYDGCTLEIQLCKPDGCLCYVASVHLYEGGFWTGHGIGCFDKTAICNDPDTCQWRRQVGGTRYELYDIFEAPNGTYFVVHGEVDPTELDPDDYDQLLEAYSGLLDSANCESERWALIAEAQFETEELSMERERFSTFEGAERAIWKKVGADVSDENSATETRLDAIRKLDKFHLAVFLNDVHSGAKDFPSNNMSWCDWLNKPDDGHLLDRKS